MVTGPAIALRIEQLLAKNQKKSRIQLGKLISTNKRIGSRGACKRVADFLNTMRRGRCMGTLKIIAQYLEVTIEYLLMGQVSPPCAPVSRAPKVRETKECFVVT